MANTKKNLSNQMSNRFSQDDILKKVSQVIDSTNGKKPSKEEDILDQPKIVKALINEGLWPAPGGAWCSCGIPIFDKMHFSKEYPMFKHFNHKDEDVTHFANLDCQTPYYFVYFENGKYNKVSKEITLGNKTISESAKEINEKENGYLLEKLTKDGRADLWTAPSYRLGLRAQCRFICHGPLTAGAMWPTVPSSINGSFCDMMDCRCRL